MNNTGKNTEEVIKPTFLFLRPFWDVDATAKQLKKIHKTTKHFGKLVVLQNYSEHTKLRLIGDENIWARHGVFLGNLYDYLNPPLNLSLIEATDKAWKECCIEQIRIADVIIVHLAPKEHPDHQETNENDQWIPDPDVYYGRNRFPKVGTGYGLLCELDYCKQENALQKTIVLIPKSYLHWVFREIKSLDLQDREKDTSLGAPMPKRSELDQALAVLHDVRFIIPYDNFGDRLFSSRLHQELSLCVESLR